MSVHYDIRLFGAVDGLLFAWIRPSPSAASAEWRGAGAGSGFWPRQGCTVGEAQRASPTPTSVSVTVAINCAFQSDFNGNVRVLESVDYQQQLGSPRPYPNGELKRHVPTLLERARQRPVLRPWLGRCAVSRMTRLRIRQRGLTSRGGEMIEPTMRVLTIHFAFRRSTLVDMIHCSENGFHDEGESP